MKTAITKHIYFKYNTSRNLSAKNHIHTTHLFTLGFVFFLKKTTSVYLVGVFCLGFLKIFNIKKFQNENFIYCPQITRIASKFPFGYLSFSLRPCTVLCLYWIIFEFSVHFWPWFKRRHHSAVRTYRTTQISEIGLLLIQNSGCKKTTLKMQIRCLEMEHRVENPKERKNIANYYLRTSKIHRKEEWNLNSTWVVIPWKSVRHEIHPGNCFIPKKRYYKALTFTR